MLVKRSCDLKCEKKIALVENIVK